MKNLSYCTPLDIAERLSYRKPYWLHGKPKIRLTGKTKFGNLIFDFGDEKISYKIFIKNREAILDAAYLAVDNFEKLLNN